MVTISLTRDECATVLAALDLFEAIWTEDGDQHYNRENLAGGEQFESGGAIPLTREQIWELGGRIDRALSSEQT